jgi:DNA-binding Lrp family transcriptional regulator
MSTVKVDAVALQTVVARRYRELDEKGIPQEFGPGISPKQEPISRRRYESRLNVIALISNAKCSFIF